MVVSARTVVFRLFGSFGSFGGDWDGGDSGLDWSIDEVLHAIAFQKVSRGVFMFDTKYQSEGTEHQHSID